MAVADLIYRIAGDSSAFVRAMKNADDQIRQSTSKLSAIGKIGGALAAGLGSVGAALTAVTTKALAEADALAKLSARTGVAVEDLSRFEYALSLSDSGLEQFAIGAKNLNKILADTQDGNIGAAKALTGLGIAATDAAGKARPMNDVILDIAERFKQLPNGAEKSRAAFDLFGKAGISLIPMLNNGKEGLATLTQEAEKLGLVLSGQTAASAELINDNISRLKQTATGLGRQIFTVLAPALSLLTTEMAQNAIEAQNMKEKQDAAILIMKTLMIAVRGVAFAFQYTSSVISRFMSGFINEASAALVVLQNFPAALNELRKGEKGPASQRITDAITRVNIQQANLEASGKKLIADFERDVERIINAQDNAAAAGLSRLEQLKAEADGIIEATKSNQQRLVEEMRKLREIFDAGLIDQATFNKRKKQLEEQYKSLGRTSGNAFGDGLKESMAKNIENATQAGAAMGQAVLAGALRVVQERRDAVANAMADAMAKVAEAREKAKQEMDALQSEGEAVRQATLTGAQSVSAEFERLNALRQVGAISAETMATAMRNLAGDDILTDVQRTQAELDKLNKLLELGAITAAEYDVALNKLFASTPAKLTEAQNFGVNAAKALQSSFADFLFDPFGQGLEGMVKGFASAMARIVAELLAKKAVLALLGAGGASPQFLAGLSLAEGGYVSGPGTGTSDSIPARLSNGEYVMPAKTVSHFGVDFMDAIRAMRPARQAPVARFAEGGYVNQQAASGGGVRVVNVVDSSMVQDFLTSSAGEQVILNTIRRNRRQVSQVMG